MSMSTDDTARWIEGCPARLRAALVRCMRGEAPANVVVMQLHADACSETDAESALARALEACAATTPRDEAVVARLDAALAVARSHPRAFATVKSMLGGVEHGGTAEAPEAGVARWAAAFDHAVRTSAEGSVALYALGDPDLLRAATAEVVDLLGAQGLLGHDRAVLDIGCGIGRFEAALAPHVGRAVGIDISAAMIDAARERCAGLDNVTFVECSGRDLASFTDASFDLVLAVDSFPYLVQSGTALATTHIREAARVLRPGGRLLILNFSYRGDVEADRSDVARLASEAGLAVVRAGTREFTFWDGLTFDLAKFGGRTAPPA